MSRQKTEQILDGFASILTKKRRKSSDKKHSSDYSRHSKLRIDIVIIMAIDYGDVRTGIAVCDKFEMLASPVCIIEQRNSEKLIEEISKLAEKHRVEQFVVGLPKNMDSSVGKRALKCKEFAQQLSDSTGIEAVMRDERLSTVSAHNVLNATNTRGKKRKAVVDQVAAVMILQDYIDYRKNIK